MKKTLFNLKKKTKMLLADKSGAQIVEWLVVAVIAIIVGGILLTLFSDSLSEIWTSMVAKMKSVFNL